MKEIKAGDVRSMTDLRDGTVKKVIVLHVPEKGKVLVALAANQERRFSVGRNFLS